MKLYMLMYNSVGHKHEQFHWSRIKNKDPEELYEYGPRFCIAYIFLHSENCQHGPRLQINMCKWNSFDTIMLFLHKTLLSYQLLKSGH